MSTSYKRWWILIQLICMFLVLLVHHLSWTISPSDMLDAPALQLALISKDRLVNLRLLLLPCLRLCSHALLAK
ncbi:hypothetical protein B0H11DRAFT_2025197 [Mycena galericulata]|nr:hypothetical protein B0H11DRAFT_2141362 [Mycena galericulata]KAJ7449353.1 hypothetical protein B0H11DRAFT_2079038 [Mycena galericulata]KAJ7480542.1 hypothetical protein B0H11DRAFT_2025197 [Mycena galericulata]